MRYLSGLMFILLCSYAVSAQQDIYLSFHTGIITNQLTFLQEDVYTYDSRNTSATVDLRLWKEFKNKWQAGVSLETGILQNQVDFRARIFSNGQQVGDQSVFGVYRVISPCMVPNVFGHYKLNMPRNNYMYAGVMAGVMTGKNDMGRSLTNITTPVVGGNLGISFSLGASASFSVYHGYRFAHVNMPDDLQYITGGPGSSNSSYYTLSDFDMHYVVNGISIICKL